jgi:hypothetical protein
MAEPGVLVPADQLRRLGAATLAVERMGVPAVGSAAGTVPESSPLVDRSAGMIRAVLCEPLFGHSTAIAVVSVRRPFVQMVDVQVMGFITNPDAFGFRLQANWNGLILLSDPIAGSATATEFQAALAPWQFGSGAVFVSHGKIEPQLIPRTLRAESISPMILCRWTLAFVGPVFQGNAPILSPISSGGGSNSVAICHRSTWESSGEFVEVIEAGLIPDQLRVNTYGYNSIRFSIPAGSAVVAGYCPGAEGWVVLAAETRKYEGPS